MVQRTIIIRKDSPVRPGGYSCPRQSLFNSTVKAGDVDAIIEVKKQGNSDLANRVRKMTYFVLFS